MNKFQHQGAELRNRAKELALSVLKTHPDAQKNGNGVKQAEVFRLSGLDWGENGKQQVRTNNIGLLHYCVN